MKLRLGFIVAGVVACMAGAYAAEQMQVPKGVPPPKPIPRQYVQASPCIPTMGEHWVNPKVPDAPIYGVYQGKPVFTEIMVLPKDLAAGKNWNNVLQPLPGYQINHVDIGYLPHGHPGMMFPHYDIHAYYVAHDVHMGWCGGEAALTKLMSQMGKTP
ncbi:MAG: hypothetical protein JOZ91_08235 [Candidatus Eremiobacteraeota bacterium]|nr:hypothetical protein [Candidatus Eremiobacteraeota bacterium]MBV8264431.1 hypothetical protein [Candidatus Eremiobacteraeota bacterium]MBV8340550.1 hypothetical protein [Candidatus Eremiobacteraeota bacterium]MBV8460634.1 hypothetical protein [Candidatus Eremiobacteraeota bacterium]MBV8596430.1 hypothetical protein [Candidatus Eremiobacteraeota bacterium]